jgi:hypothetical protein
VALLTRSTPRRSLWQRYLDSATPRQLAMGRVGLGTMMVVRPRTLPQSLGVDSATSARVAWAIQMLGVRDAALGLGTLAALKSPDSRAARTWIAAGVLSDAVDALAIGGALLRGRVTKSGGGAAVVVAAAAAALGLRELNEDEADR